MRRSASVPLVLALLLAACQSGEPKGSCTSAGFPAPDQEFVWNAALRATTAQGFAPDLEASAKEGGTLVTRWKLSLAPFSGHGYREQATVRINPVEGRPKYWTTETVVIRQHNENMTQPTNPVVAQWGAKTRAADVELLINRRIEMDFLAGCVSPQFRQRYGMPAAEDRRLEDLERGAGYEMTPTGPRTVPMPSGR
jgi:hypothetical protein